MQAAGWTPLIELALSKESTIVTCLSETQQQAGECESFMMGKMGGFKYVLIRGLGVGKQQEG